MTTVYHNLLALSTLERRENVKTNQKVRDAARIADVPLYAIAHKIGISEPTFSRWIRFQLPPEKEKQILAAIKELEKEAE